MSTDSLPARPKVDGFTLVELMVALVLSTFLIGSLVLSFISTRAASAEAEQLARTQENLRFASDFIVRDLRNAGFRDEGNLYSLLSVEIGRCFATYGDFATPRFESNHGCTAGGDSSRLSIRYAGLGACGLQFDGSGELRMIENTYSVENGELLCEGKEVEVSPTPDGGDSPPTVSTTSVVLASGLESVSFSFVFPDGVTPQDFCRGPTNEDPGTSCLGVEIEMEFEGQPQRTATLTAAFRNEILGRLFADDEDS